MSKLKSSAERKIVGSFLLMVVVLVFLAVLSYYNSIRYKETSEWVIHTNEILYYSEQIMSSAIDIETGQRGYVITGDRIFLEHYEVARVQIGGHIAKLKALSTDNANQQKRIDTLNFLTERRLKLLEKIVNLRSGNSSITERIKTMSYESKSLLDNFRKVLKRCQQEENELLRIRMKSNERESITFNITLGFLILFILLILAASYLVIHRHLGIREKNERMIRANWQMLQSVLDNTNAVIYIKDLDGRYVLVNKKFASHANCHPNDLIGKTAFDLVDEETAKTVTEKDKKVIETEAHTEYEEAMDYNNVKYPCIISKFPLKNENGKVYAICGMVTDISEFKKTEEMLVYQSYMINNASDAIIASELDYTITYWNKSAERIYGHTSDVAVGQKVFSLLNSNKKVPENMGEIIVDAIKENGKWEGEFSFETKTGVIIPISTSTSFIKDKEGQPIGILAINRDISQRIKQEEDIIQLNKELEAFTYSVSHDLRAPLRSIDGYSRILLEDYYNIVDEGGKKVINVIVNNAVRMGKLIDDLLTFSKMGRQSMYKKLVNMNDIVQLSLTDFENGMDIRLAQVSILELPYAKGDINMLRQVWTNLISNALKYSSKKDEPFIEIGGYSETNHEVYYVRDNGVGFDMQYVHKLYGVFQRLHRLEEFEGTGVGLALVQRVISKHGGSVWAEGKTGEGATFYFSLPKEEHKQ